MFFYHKGSVAARLGTTTPSVTTPFPLPVCGEGVLRNAGGKKLRARELGRISVFAAWAHPTKSLLQFFYIGVGMARVGATPPSEPDGRISRIRLSS
jgi:hypothetical protein